MILHLPSIFRRRSHRAHREKCRRDPNVERGGGILQACDRLQGLRDDTARVSRVLGEASDRVLADAGSEGHRHSGEPCRRRRDHPRPTFSSDARPWSRRFCVSFPPPDPAPIVCYGDVVPGPGRRLRSRTINFPVTPLSVPTAELPSGGVPGNAAAEEVPELDEHQAPRRDFRAEVLPRSPWPKESKVHPRGMSHL